jgi:putative hydrolase of the HAD superfamily
MHYDKAPSIKTVIFDFGGVFTTSPMALAKTFATDAGVDPEGLMDIMLGDYGVESDHPWQRVERGELPLDEARTWARLETKHRLGVEIDPHDMMGQLMSEPVREPMLALVRDLRDAGNTVGLLTNNAKELRHQWGSLADWPSLFDAVVDSSEAGLRKPSPEAFALALQRCGEGDASRALMVDDFEQNVAGARSIGMHAVLVAEDPAPAVAEIRELVLR